MPVYSQISFHHGFDGKVLRDDSFVVLTQPPCYEPGDVKKVFPTKVCRGGSDTYTSCLGDVEKDDSLFAVPVFLMVATLIKIIF